MNKVNRRQLRDKKKKKKKGRRNKKREGVSRGKEAMGDAVGPTKNGEVGAQVARNRARRGRRGEKNGRRGPVRRRVDSTPDLVRSTVDVNRERKRKLQ